MLSCLIFIRWENSGRKNYLFLLLMYTVAWINLKNTMLSKNSHTKEYEVFHSIYIKPKNHKKLSYIKIRTVVVDENGK
jgi:hypothetical protein